MGVCGRLKASTLLERVTAAGPYFGFTDPRRPTVAARSAMLAWSASAGSTRAIGVSTQTAAGAAKAAIGASC